LRLRLILSSFNEGLNKPDSLNQPGPLNPGRSDENRRLKKLLAESMLDVEALKDLLAKN